MCLGEGRVGLVVMFWLIVWDVGVLIKGCPGDVCGFGMKSEVFQSCVVLI